MVETELKFQIEPARCAALRRAVAGTGGSARTIRLQARYFDTADGRLAAAGLALRLRREGRQRWVQGLKGRGDGLLRRLEHEVVLPAGAAPAIDLARHDGTPAGDALRAALGSQAAELLERFATDVRRTRRLVRTRGPQGSAATVEIALDQGRIVAAGPEGPARLALSEVEFELHSGSPQALLALASRWVQRHGLWLDVRSKAERGHALADAAAAEAVQAQPPLIGRRMTRARGLAAMVQAALAQVLPNLAALASAQGAGAQHVHQLRVGLRRLRTALGQFGRGVDTVDEAWHSTLAQAFDALGALRDRDVAWQTLAPAREAACRAGLQAPPLPPKHGTACTADDTAVLRERGFNQVMLALIGLVLAGETAVDGRPLIGAARRRLDRLHQQVAADGARFALLDHAARHRLRRRVKRLRYCIEFVAPLFAAKPLARYLALLRPAQEALGDYNDVLLAEAVCRTTPLATAADAFVLGWLGARRDALADAAAARLQALAAAPRFWRR